MGITFALTSRKFFLFENFFSFNKKRIATILVNSFIITVINARSSTE